MHPWQRNAIFMAGGFAAALLVAWIVRSTPPGAATGGHGQGERPALSISGLSVASQFNAELARVAAAVLPGVVSIHVERVIPVTDEILRPNGRLHSEPREAREPSIGSGAIVTREGRIVTNWHVVEGDDAQISVTLHGEESPRRARIIDKDDQLDFAILQVEPRTPGESFHPLRFGDSDAVETGNIVLAIGSPFNLNETITFGIISNRGRRVSDTYTAYLQITCTINPGNSGGPLVNLQGEIVGLVTRKLLGPEDKASAEGYGLAIPGNDASEAFERLTSKGRPRPYLGLTIDDWPPHYYQQQRDPEAVVVKGMARRSPAVQAGFLREDIIESIDGERTAGTAAFRRVVRKRQVGETLTFAVRRNDESLTLRVTLADFDKALPETSPVVEDTVQGITVRTLRRYERNLLGLDEAIGLKVLRVADDSPFKQALRPGVSLLHVSGRDRVDVLSVASPEDLKSALARFGAGGGWVGSAARPGDPTAWHEFPPLP